MYLRIRTQSIFILSLIIPVLSLDWFHSNNKVLLSDIKTLTFEKGVYTQGRRLTPVPQLTCVGENCTILPNVISCVNSGFDGFEVVWKCHSKGFVFNRTAVDCEGYNNQNDPYVAKDSCRLRYNINSVDLKTPSFWFNLYLLFPILVIMLVAFIHKISKDIK